MEFKPFKEDLSEICTKEEIEELNSMMKVCKVDPNKLLDGINARKLSIRVKETNYFMLMCLSQIEHGKLKTVCRSRSKS